MENIEVNVEKSILVIRIDLSKKGRVSSTGKMQLLASSGGWKAIEQNVISDEIKMNLQLGYRRN